MEIGLGVLKTSFERVNEVTTDGVIATAHPCQIATVMSRYFDFAYLEYPLLSKWGSMC